MRRSKAEQSARAVALVAGKAPVPVMEDPSPYCQRRGASCLRLEMEAAVLAGAPAGGAELLAAVRRSRLCLDCGWRYLAAIGAPVTPRCEVDPSLRVRRPASPALILMGEGPYDG